MPVREIQSQADFEALKAMANVVVDFSASWCGPCRNIAPKYEELSNKYPAVGFFKVDVDASPEVAQIFSVSSMPTFIFIKDGNMVERFSGADPAKLEDSIKKLINGDAGAGSAAGAAAAAAADCGVAGCNFLNDIIDKTQIECSNESAKNVVGNLFTDSDTYVESDCDEQLIISFSFQQPVKLHSLRLRCPDVERAPKTIKIFTNRTSSLDFDEAESLDSVQTIELSDKDITTGQTNALQFVKFQKVTRLTLFIQDNQGGADTSAISFLQCIGQSNEATNMKNFTRVSGKPGEGE